MKAKKENKVYRITTDSEKQRYLKAGYDIYDDEGNVLAYSPLKKIEYGKYVEVQKENDSLKAEIEALKNAGNGADDEAVIAILTAYAQEHEIDLGRATTISGILKKINEPKAGE